MLHAALTALLLVVLASPSACGPQLENAAKEMKAPLQDFGSQFKGRFRRIVIFVRPKVLSVTPRFCEPKMNRFFDWLLGPKKQNPRLVADSVELLSTPAKPASELPRPTPRPTTDPEEVKKQFAIDLDAAMAEFHLKEPLENIKGVSGTVTGDHGLIKWIDKVKRVNGKTDFEGEDEISAKVVFEFSVNITYEYHLRAAIDRDGHTTTVLRHQYATVEATLIRPHSFYECYISRFQILYPKVLGEVETEIRATHRFRIPGYQGGAITSRLYPQCHTDIEIGIKYLLPPFAVDHMMRKFKELLGRKICENA